MVQRFHRHQPTRTIAGLKAFGQKIILIAGGYDKKIPYEPLAPYLCEKVSHLILMALPAPRSSRRWKPARITMDSIRRYIGPNRWSRRYRLRMVWRAAGDIVAVPCQRQL